MSPTPLRTLAGQAVLLLEGPDAASFLHGQLTADVLGLGPGRATLAALCSPQGRVIATLRVGRLARGLAIILPRTLALPVAARLQRHILRAKVVVSDQSQDWIVVLPPADSAAPWPANRWETVQLGAGRALAVGPAAAPGAPTTASSADAAWNAASVALGEPEVEAATSEAWVPQMLNLDLLGALSPTKGCYTGQEVVARVQHRGRIKRRMFRYRYLGGPPPAAGTTLYCAGEETARVVRAAGGADRGELLAVAGVEAGHRELTDAAGALVCAPLALPYAVPEATAAA